MSVLHFETVIPKGPDGLNFILKPGGHSRTPKTEKNAGADRWLGHARSFEEQENLRPNRTVIWTFSKPKTLGI